MLSSLLPGVRELRTPLAIGYLWLINLWVIAGGSLPRHKPGSGPFALLWTLGSYAGRTGVIVAASFAAYMIGAFVEIDPLRLWEYSGRPAWITRIRNVLRRGKRLSRIGVFPMSSQASRHLASYSRDVLGEDVSHGEVMDLLRKIVSGEQQIATRLQVTNCDLYNKYDRLLAESAFRLNVAFPLTALLVVVISLSGVPLHWKVVLTAAAVCYGALLLRQAVIRAVRSRDVVIQALITGLVESRSLKRTSSGGQPGSTNRREAAGVSSVSSQPSPTS